MMIEYHDLPDNGNKTSCWLSVEETFYGRLFIRYHYTLNGAYLIDYQYD